MRVSTLILLVLLYYLLRVLEYEGAPAPAPADAPRPQLLPDRSIVTSYAWPGLVGGPAGAREPIVHSDPTGRFLV